MLPIIALVGRPNVGKSTIFNTILGSRDALVVDVPGTTRDRHFGKVSISGKSAILVDTGGIGLEDELIDDKTSQQSFLALEQSDVVFFVVDASHGLTPIDIKIAESLRGQTKPVYLIVNKIDGIDPWEAESEFSRLGFSNKVVISAKTKRGIHSIKDIVADYAVEEDVDSDSDLGIKACIIGRPNVGKSTLTNRIIGEERVIVMDHPGTTRDSVYIPFVKDDRRYTLIDTAGVRKKSKINDKVEKFSVLKALQAIDKANVVLLVIDASVGLVEQDLRLLRFATDSGKSLLIVVNKCDNLKYDEREQLKREIKNRLKYIGYAEFYFISALKGKGINPIVNDIEKAYDSATRKFATSILNRILSDLITKHQPKMVNGRRIKMRFAHFAGVLPPTIVIHGNQVDELPESYRRYLAKGFVKSLGLFATPVKLIFNKGDNPYV